MSRLVNLNTLVDLFYTKVGKVVMTLDAKGNRLDLETGESSEFAQILKALLLAKVLEGVDIIDGNALAEQARQIVNSRRNAIAPHNGTRDDAEG